MNSVLKERPSISQIKRSRPQPAWKRQLRYLYLRFVRMKEHPHVIARGLAVGVFAGCFPLFGLQTIIGVALAFLVRGNKLAAAVGTWISNPLTYVPLFAFNYKIGRWILGEYSHVGGQAKFSQNWDSWSEMTSLGTDFLVILFVGCAVVGAVASIIAYVLCLRLLNRHRHPQP
ncbi:MAG: DUF2062 domain-containing protein [Microcystaceae cyanobacterium]